MIKNLKNQPTIHHAGNALLATFLVSLTPGCATHCDSNGKCSPALFAYNNPRPDPASPQAGKIVEPATLVAGDVTFTARADADVRAISPLIYGINQRNTNAATQKGYGLMRAGGNRWTAHNWETNYSNAGSDYGPNSNDSYLVNASNFPYLGLNSTNTRIPGQAVRARIDDAFTNGASALITVPMLGYVSRAVSGNATAGTRNIYFLPTYARKTGTLSLAPDLNDEAVYQDEFVHWVRETYKGVNGAFAQENPKILFSLDNEPDLWTDTHADIQPTLDAEDFLNRTRDSAAMVKDLIPNAKVTGFVSYGYMGFMNFQNAFVGGRLANGTLIGNSDFKTDNDFISYFLGKMKDFSDAQGRRLVDVLDLHWYPEAQGSTRIIGNGTSDADIAARIQAPRSLWDTTYNERSWVQSHMGAPIALIPRLAQKISKFNPGTKIGFTEYYYGGGCHISGAIAQADVLGIFGREGVYVANIWEMATSHAVNAALRMFTSYDGGSGRFGDTSVRAQSSDYSKSSFYAGIDAANSKRMTLVAINKTNGPLKAAIHLSAYGMYRSAELYQLTGSSIATTAGGCTGATINSLSAIAASDVNAFEYTMPAYSVTVLVPKE